MKTRVKKKKEITLDDLALMMGRGFNEVDKKFDKVYEKMDKGFTDVREEMDSGFVEVDKKFVIVHEEISELRGEVGELKNNFNSLQISVDGYAKRADDYFQEMRCFIAPSGVTFHKVDRIERWVLQLAEKVGVQLKA